jgi:WD40 repeat protein
MMLFAAGLSLLGAPSDPELILQTGHFGTVSVISFSPEGSWVATGSHDSTLKLWDLHTGQQVRTLAGHSKRLQTTVFSPDGKYIASKSIDHELRVWEVSTGTDVVTLRKAQSGRTIFKGTIAFSPDGRWLAETDGSNETVLWDWRNTEQRSTPQVLHGASPAVVLAFSPDGHWLSSAGGRKGELELWDFSTKTNPRHLEGHTQRIGALAFSADSRSLISASDDQTVIVWDTSSAQPIHRQTRPAGVEYVLSPNGRLLACGTIRDITVWNVDDEKTRILTGHTHYISALAFSKDGLQLGSAAIIDNSLKIWSLDITGEAPTLKGTTGGIHDLQFSVEGTTGGVHDLQFSKDGRWLAVIADDRIQLWDLVAGRETRTLVGRSDACYSLAFSQDSKLLAAANSAELRLWDLTTGKTVQTIRAPGSSDLDLFTRGVALSPDRRIIVSGSPRGLNAWEISTGHMLPPISKQLAKDDDTISSSTRDVVFSADGRWLAYVQTDDGRDSLKLWDVASWRLSRTLLTTTEIDAVAFGPRSDWVVAVTGRGTQMLDINTGRSLKVFRGYQNLAVSSDGTLLASFREGSIRIWQTDTGQEVRALEKRNGSATYLAFGAEGHLLASGGRSGKVDLWYPDQAELIVTLIGVTQASNTFWGQWLVVAPDGLFDGSADAMHQVSWRVDATNELRSLEDYFFDFFYPGLLIDALEGRRPKASMDLSVLLHFPGLQAMLKQPEPLVHVEPLSDGTRVCFHQKPTAIAYLGVTANPDHPLCPWSKDIKGAFLQEGIPRQRLPITPATIAKRSNTPLQRATLHMQGIGVSNYPISSGLTSLPASLSAVASVTAFFDKQSYGSGALFSSISLSQSQADRESIRESLFRMSNAMKTNDVAFVLFSGHGIVPEDQEMFYFAPSDWVGTTARERQRTGISTAIIAEAVRDFPAKRVILIVDACQSGAILDSLAKIAEIKRRVDNQSARFQTTTVTSEARNEGGIFIIAATSSVQNAGQSPTSDTTPLISTLLEALRGAVPSDEEGNIWMSDVAQYIRERLPEASKLSGGGFAYTPVIVSSGSDFPIATVNRR